MVSPDLLHMHFLSESEGSTDTISTVHLASHGWFYSFLSWKTNRPADRGYGPHPDAQQLGTGLSAGAEGRGSGPFRKNACKTGMLLAAWPSNKKAEKHSAPARMFSAVLRELAYPDYPSLFDLISEN